MKNMKTIVGVAGCLLLLVLFGSCGQEQMFTENRTLEMSTEGLRVMEINGGNGDIGITGTAAAETITVRGNISVSGEDTEKIREMIGNQLVFTLEKRGNRAVLNARFAKSFFLVSMFLDRGRKIDIDIEVPDSLELAVADDGGNLYIAEMKNDIVINDEDGSCILENITAKSVKIIDNAGPVIVTNAAADIDIIDKSGDIELSRCGGEMRITDTTGDLLLEMCKGALYIDDSTGKITVEEHTGDITIKARSRGDVSLRNVNGQIIQNY
jgi:DUF4097 and DUF4098 domain-containing protein YvlB